jgi:hypothetical protein
LTLLEPYFESFDETSGNGDLESPTEPFERQTFTINNPSFIASSFLLEIEALEPNRMLSLTLVKREGNMSFGDLNGFGSFYYKLRLDSGCNTFEIVMADGSSNDISSYLTADSGFFLLEPGENQIEILSKGMVKITTFLVRQRWYI